jgi:hypothetical protein
MYLYLGHDFDSMLSDEEKLSTFDFLKRIEISI